MKINLFDSKPFLCDEVFVGRVFSCLQKLNTFIFFLMVENKHGKRYFLMTQILLTSYYTSMEAMKNNMEELLLTASLKY